MLISLLLFGCVLLSSARSQNEVNPLYPVLIHPADKLPYRFPTMNYYSYYPQLPEDPIQQRAAQYKQGKVYSFIIILKF